MSYMKRPLKTLMWIFLAIAVLACVSFSEALAEDTATVVGQATVNNELTNGVTVTIGGLSATTRNYMGSDGTYIINGLPLGNSLTFKASYNGYEHKDTVDPISGNCAIPTVNIDIPVSTPTPTPDPNATATPTPTPTPTPTATPTPTPTATPTPTPRPNSNTQPVSTPTYTPTPSPTVETDLSQLNTSAATPSPRKVFSSPNWDADHETINVTNNGGPITVLAWIDSPSNNITIPVDAGARQTVSTTSILTQNNQIVNVGFDAYENGTKIDSYKAMISVDMGSTPSPTTARSPGFDVLLGLLCLLGTAYLIVKKER